MSKTESTTAKVEETQKGRISTEKLIASKENNLKLAGVTRILGSCFSSRAESLELKPQTIDNRVSKIVKELRFSKDLDKDSIKKAIKLTVKNWELIKDCLKDEKVEMNEEMIDLFALLSTFGKKSKKSLKDIELPTKLDFK